MTDKHQKTYDYTTAERMRRLRQRRKEAGFVNKQVFVHADDWPEIEAIIKKRNSARGF